MIAQAPSENAKPAGGANIFASLGWQAILLAILLVGLCVPIFIDINPLWHNERGGHCIFILPHCIGLTLLRRDLLKQVVKEADARGLWLIAAGLLIELFSFMLRMAFIEGYALA